VTGPNVAEEAVGLMKEPEEEFPDLRILEGERQ
jgi:hypothetical protein